MGDETANHPRLRVVGVGSSAGGLEAVAKLLAGAPSDAPWCFVLAQHRAPDQDSALVELLSHSTSMTVATAVDGTAVERGAVYVVPPGSDIVVTRGTLRLPDASPQRRPWPSIDRLLVSLATEFGPDAVGVILSGTGSDGAAGATAIRHGGGVIAVQDPSTAAFEQMPHSTLDTGSVNLTAAAESIGAELHDLLFGRSARPMDEQTESTEDVPDLSEGYQPPPAAPDDTPELAAADLDTIIECLRLTTGIDYSGYKRSTLSRQIERRRRGKGISITDYAAELSIDTVEAGALARAILVSVTSFFRDGAVWESVGTRLKTLARSLPAGEPLRLWVPGCATGEEAYTIAMLAADALCGDEDRSGLSSRLKVFATDLDEAALTVARRGQYRAAAIDTVPQRLRDRWLYRSTAGWAVVPELRECMVIARHNVAYDPPFPRVHLISLRNTLIYFEPRLQARVMDLCHYALVPDGLVVLGLSERISNVDAVFTAVDYTHRIYRRGDSSRLPSLAVTRRLQAPPVQGGNYPNGAGGPARADAELPYRRILQITSAPMLILDDRDVLIEVIGDVSAWCTVGEGRQTGAVTEILRDPYRLGVRTLLSQLRQTDSNTAELVTTNQNRVRITAALVPTEFSTRTVLSFRAEEARRTRVAADSSDESVPVLDVSAQLDSTQRALEAIVTDLGSSNEELQAMNEELQASSEELQATTEEAQAANEELEATNEELTTLNQELQARTNEALQANTDLTNIQSSLTSGLIIVDRELRVTRFTPLAVRLFSLIDADHGRALVAIPTTVEISGLEDDLRATLDHRQSRIREINSANADYLLQTQPYVGANGDVRGVIVVVTDVGEISATRRARDAALNNFHLVADSIREIVWQRDATGTLTFINSRVEEIYGLDRDRVLAEPTLLLSTVHPADRDRVATVSAAAEQDWSCEYRIVRPDGSIRWIEEAAHTIRTVDPADRLVIGSAVDVTDRRVFEDQAAERTAVLDALFGTVTAGIVVLDRENRILSISSGFTAITRFEPHELVGTSLSMLIDRRAGSVPQKHTPASTVPDEGPFDNWVVVDAHGSSHPISIEFHTVPMKSDSSTGPHSVAVVHDTSRIRAISADLAAREQFDRHTGLLTRQFFRSRLVDLLDSEPTRVAALWIDLDGFKEINDRFGHRAGDIVLTTVAARLQHAARRHDIVGRLGGDEFAVLVTRSEDLDSLEILSNRILQDVRNPITLADSTVYVSASIGIALSPGDGTTADELLHNADTAMYEAKKSGRDRHMYFAASMNEIADERASIRHELGEAFRNNDFELHYQPIVDVTTGGATMLEALVRWRRGEVVVPAQEFIDHATQTGHLRALGKIVLTLLDADMLVFERELGAGRPRVAANFSGIELDEREVIDRLITWAPPGGFDKLVIEVTESALLDEHGRARDTLGILKRFGAKISIDDFGTGYSNLELLDRLEPDVIKIDRSLLQRALDHPRGKDILDAAVQLARALDAETVIEGVENQQMWDYVRTLGVNMAQGYHIARPMPLRKAIEWLTSADSS
ncbi:EAL domain-containing protein [Rhodococcus sp. IEGM 1330]|uniref:EAL domain-containing protein n=1 Tax=Rhodococcus sp. IEGM 1330 TaxID=3082225 RepID=UPI0029541043|nr:EAL domain-containing protein [Rhodococcus sp. IEGM 1330]MDV8023436.1 EAL domain-containing protein [Rhodococcus sp. IEGM 1330]